MRFRKTIKIAPGIKLNLSKSGISSTVGGKGLSATIGKNGAYLNTGIPGTGVSARTKIGGKTAVNSESNYNIVYNDNERAENKPDNPNLQNPEYNLFKEKILNANGKIDFATNLSYYVLFNTIPKNENILFATQYRVFWTYGAFVVTNSAIYAACKSVNQKISIWLNEIISVSAIGHSLKDVRINTNSGKFIFKRVVNLKETIAFLGKDQR
jgi:hypothetical protein